MKQTTPDLSQRRDVYIAFQGGRRVRKIFPTLVAVENYAPDGWMAVSETFSADPTRPGFIIHVVIIGPRKNAKGHSESSEPSDAHGG